MSQTVSEYDAQIAELKRQRDIASLESVKATQAIMKRASTGKVADDLEALLGQLPAGEMVHQQASNVINIIRGTTNLIDQETARVQAVVDAHAEAG